MKTPIVTGMRLLVLTGILLVALGVFIVLKGVMLHSTGLVSVGPFHSTVHAEHTVPVTLGWVAIAIGVLLAVAGGLGERGKR